jgi:hypothetical protein
MRKSRKKNIDEFINDADSQANNKKMEVPAIKKEAYKIYTFSLDKKTSDKIDELTLKTRNIRANRSEIVRAAINFFDNATLPELEEFISSVKKV